MAVWPYIPQQVYDEDLYASAIRNVVGPLADVCGSSTDEFVRVFRLRYVVVTSEDCLGMARFFTRQYGPAYPFDFINPNDGRAYQVRFTEGMRLDLFTPIFFATNELSFTVVTS